MHQPEAGARREARQLGGQRRVQRPSTLARPSGVSASSTRGVGRGVDHDVVLAPRPRLDGVGVGEVEVGPGQADRASGSSAQQRPADLTAGAEHRVVRRRHRGDVVQGRVATVLLGDLRVGDRRAASRRRRWGRRGRAPGRGARAPVVVDQVGVGDAVGRGSGSRWRRRAARRPPPPGSSSTENEPPKVGPSRRSTQAPCARPVATETSLSHGSACRPRVAPACSFQLTLACTGPKSGRPSARHLLALPASLNQPRASTCSGSRSTSRPGTGVVSRLGSAAALTPGPVAA